MKFPPLACLTELEKEQPYSSMSDTHKKAYIKITGLCIMIIQRFGFHRNRNVYKYLTADTALVNKHYAGLWPAG